MSHGPLTPEHKAKLRAAKLGGKHSPEHKLRIGEGVRRAYAEGRGRSKSFLRLLRLTEAERADHQTLMIKGRFRSHEALAILGRADLIEGNQI